MRTLVFVVLSSVALVLGTPSLPGVAARSPDARALAHSRSAVSLSVSTGYEEQYRMSAWVPVRVTLRNRTAAMVPGTVTVLDQGGASQLVAPEFSSLYQSQVVLPSGGSKQVTLYLPGEDIGGQVAVQFRAAGRVLATASDSPTSVGDRTITVGTLAGDPQLVAWLRLARPQNSSVALVRLSPATLDPVPQALASLDTIVFTNVDTSVLDRDQLDALLQYVRNGGSLILVGGPDWQETLRPLPRALIPGTLVGSRALSDLSGLQALSVGAGYASGTRRQSDSVPPRQRTIVSVLAYPRGSVVASEAGVPLAVRYGFGQGRILYLAFDPSVDSLQRWTGGAALWTDLVTRSAPQVVSRLTAINQQAGLFGARLSPSMILQELTNAPAASLPSQLLLVIFTIVTVLMLGPLNFLLLHRLGRRELAAITIPAIALLCLGSTLGASYRFKGNLALLNTVGMVELDGSGQSHPASLYVGLFTSVRGDYHLVWDGRALPQGLPGYSFDQTSQAGTAPVGMHLQEGPQTTVDFLSMNMWSTRGVALKTTVAVQGALHADLHLESDGSIAGVLRNDTNFRLIRPAVLAGSAVLHLPDLGPGQTQPIHIRPYVDIRRDSPSQMWEQIYGTSSASYSIDSWDGDPWETPSLAAEHSLIDRLRNVVEAAPEANSLVSSAEILFVGWSEAPLGTFTLDGATPRRRDLNLITSPLAVRFPRSAFQLRPGTLGASLIDVRPQQPANGCCDSPVASHAIALGTGGSGTFQFDIPNAAHVHFRRLTLMVNLDGADAGGIGQAYNWRSRQWVGLNLQSGADTLNHPDQFISPQGALLLRLHSTDTSGDLILSNPLHDLQISGWATVR